MKVVSIPADDQSLDGDDEVVGKKAHPCGRNLEDECLKDTSLPPNQGSVTLPLIGQLKLMANKNFHQR